MENRCNCWLVDNWSRIHSVQNSKEVVAVVLVLALALVLQPSTLPTLSQLSRGTERKVVWPILREITRLGCAGTLSQLGMELQGPSPSPNWPFRSPWLLQHGSNFGGYPGFRCTTNTAKCWSGRWITHLHFEVLQWRRRQLLKKLPVPKG